MADSGLSAPYNCLYRPWRPVVPPFGEKRMIQTNLVPTVRPHSRPRAGLFAAVSNLFISVWLGVFWAVLLFIYCSIGSALPAVRQLPALEMTEFEWFHWNSVISKAGS